MLVSSPPSISNARATSSATSSGPVSSVTASSPLEYSLSPSLLASSNSFSANSSNSSSSGLLARLRRNNKLTNKETMSPTAIISINVLLVTMRSMSSSKLGERAIGCSAVARSAASAAWRASVATTSSAARTKDSCN